ncbi:S8 family serine peptidase [Bacillus sp. CGMCC 1.16607]|uniref:S8 family serine peptidase n=1 Tax=Bacillus sp. CGMCC 1.16607 TaxID=3351842 RepID=UPI00363FE381
MSKRFIKSVIISSGLLLTFAPLGVGANVKTSTTENVQLAELFGDYNFASSQTTSVIVELKEPSILEAKHKGKSQSKSNLSNARNQVKSNLSKIVKNSNVNREYDYVFSGFSVELPANQIPELLALPGVKAVYPNVTYNVTSVGDGEAISEEEYSPNMLDSAPHIGANQAWDSGFTGKGVTVAVIDTGADYTHPDLAHAFSDYKGWDFVDNDNDPQETPKGDPRGNSTDHGSHVAGTVAANGLIKGVAPDATLLAYRVLGPGGSGSTENVIAGVEKAVQDGADVMNLSLGNSLNAPDWATSIALDWAMAEGVVAVTSNGNSGPNNWTVGSPGTSRQAISVGATQLPYNVFDASITTSEGISYPSSKVMGFPNDKAITDLKGQTLEFVDVGFGSPAEFVGKDIQGKVALISRGAGIAFVDKASAAKDAGAVAAIIYNNVAGEIVVVPGTAIPTLRTTQEDGEKLKSELTKGNNKVTFDVNFNSRYPETMADFSSRGPATGTWMIKPDVSAPGVNIRSTIPTHDPANPHGYGSKQGTSMASPHVAGAAALLLQAHPDWNVDDVKAAFMNTAEDLINPATGLVYPHNTQGAGSIRVVDAIKTDTLVTPGSHSFGTFYKDKGKQVEKQHFTIKNLSSDRQTYSFEVNFGESSDAIKVSTSNNLKVNAGQSQQVNLNVQVDAGQLAPGHYEGTINISNGNKTINVPTILFVKEPDYPRVSSMSVSQDSNGPVAINGYFPGGAETAVFFIYTATSTGSPVQFIGVISEHTNVPAGYNTFDWDGTVNGQKLGKGFYNLYSNATYAGKTTQSGVNFEIK